MRRNTVAIRITVEFIRAPVLDFLSRWASGNWCQSALLVHETLARNVAGVFNEYERRLRALGVPSGMSGLANVERDLVSQLSKRAQTALTVLEQSGNTICLALDRAYKNGAHIDMDLRQLAKSLREELRPQRGNASSKRIETHTVERNVAGGMVPPQSANAVHGITKSASSASTSPNIGNLSDGRVVFRDESGVTRKAEDTKFSPGHDVAVKSDPRGLAKVYRNLVHPAMKRTQRSLPAFDFGGNDFCAGASLWKF